MNNKQLLSALRQLQKSLPPQVLLQQPVMFTDALNRIAPIHLEWIDSWDAFQAVLQVRFTHLGYNKVKRREFALQDTVTRKELLNTTPIAVCLMPGQKIDMSMIFQDQSERPSNTCPHCQTSCEGLTDSETIWYVRTWCLVRLANGDLARIVDVNSAASSNRTISLKPYETL